jgi:MFS family permease
MAQWLPWLLLSLLSGVVVDRVDRRKLQFWTNVFRAVVLGALALGVGLEWVSIYFLFIATFFLGAAETFFDNAAFALLPAVVSRNDLEQANSRIYTTQTIANEFVGPPVGGLLFAMAAAISLGVDVAFYLLAAILVGLLRGSFRPHRRVEVTNSAKPASLVWQEMVEGVRWFWNHRLLHLLGVKAAFEHACWAATNALLVLVAQERLGMDAAGYGLLLSAGAVGGVIGGITASWLIQRIGGGSAVLLNLLIQSVAFVGIALSTSPIVVALMLIGVSFTGSIGGIVGISFRQAIIPDELLGRVVSVFRMYALGGMALGALLGGLLARRFGLLTPYWLSSALLLLLFFYFLPKINNHTLKQAQLAAEIL